MDAHPWSDERTGIAGVAGEPTGVPVSATQPAARDTDTGDSAGTGTGTGSGTWITTVATTGLVWRSLYLVLPYPPSVNRRYLRAARSRSWLRSGSGMRASGDVVLHPQVRAYCETVLGAVLEACGGRKPIVPANTELSLRLVLVPPDRRRRDIDNPLKCLLDCVAHALGVDDSQFTALTVRRRPCGQGQPGAYAVVAWKE